MLLNKLRSIFSSIIWLFMVVAYRVVSVVERAILLVISFGIWLGTRVSIMSQWKESAQERNMSLIKGLEIRSVGLTGLIKGLDPDSSSIPEPIAGYSVTVRGP